MNFKILFYLITFFCISLFMLYRIFKWYKRKVRLAKRGPRSTSSRIWRETYMEKLSNMLDKSLKNNLKEIYSITFGSAEEDTYKKIIKYIDSKSYRKLTSIMNTVPTSIDDFGESIQGSIYDVLAIIDKQNNYYIGIIHKEYVEKYDLKLEFITKVDPFDLETFKLKRLVYPI